MAGPIEFPKTTLHSRSNSLPSTSHPLTICLDDHLRSLKASDATTCSTSSIFKNLGCLKDLYERVNELIHLPSFQKALSHKISGSDEVLEASVRLLDVCATARDVLSNTKESVLELQSCFRRKTSGAALEHEVATYTVSRKKINKLVLKCMKDVKTFEKHSNSMILDEDNSDLVVIINMIREVQTISFSVLKSVMSHVCGTKAMLKQSGWSLVSKFVQTKRSPFAANNCEVEMIDEALNALTIQKACKDINNVAVANVQKQLQALECALVELEKGLEPIFKCLLNTQVSLLNVLNH